MTHAVKPRADLDKAASELSLAVGQLLRKLRTEANPGTLSLSQMSAMARLEQNGPMTTADLARAESMKPQSMAAILASLETEGLVQRQPHPSDGRQVLMGLTALGLEQRRQRGIAQRAWLVRVMAELEPAEVQALLAAIPLLKRLGNA